MKRRIFVNIFSNWANLLIVIIVRFALTPFLIQKLGDVEYGIWILIISVIGYMQLLNLGINTAIVRYISKYIEIKDDNKSNEIFNTSFFMFVLLAIVICLAVLLLSIFMPHYYDFGEHPLYRIIFIIVGINLAFEFVFYVFSAVLGAREKFLESNIIETCTFLIRTVFIVIALVMGHKLMAVALIQICANLVRGSILTIYCLRVTPVLKFDLKFVRKDVFKKIFNYTFYNLLVKISTKINMTGSILIIGYYLSAGAVTFYSIPVSLITYLHNLVLQIERVLIPRFSQLEAQNNNEQIQEYFLALTRYSLIITIPIIFIFIFYGNPFIKLWIGDKYAELSGKILAILAVGKIFHISQISTETALRGIGKHKVLSFLRSAESAIVLILTIALVKKYELIGVAYANTIPLVIFNFLIIPIYACKLLKISIARYYMKYILKNVLVILPIYLIFQSINYPVNTYSMLGMSILSITIIFIILSFIFILDLKERKLVYSLLKLRGSDN